MNVRPIPFLILALTACGSAAAPTAPTDVVNFLGKWTYDSGSAITIDCAGAPEQAIDLSMVPPANQPGYFTFSLVSGDAIHEVDARGCEYDWTVAGDVATAGPGQRCATFPDGQGGNRAVIMQSGTKSTSDGATITVDVHFTTDPPGGCAIAVRGTATKS
jgi:hypothetical protein